MTLRTERSAYAFEIRGTGRQPDSLNTRAGQCVAERDREEPIPIVDQEALAREEAIADVRDVATRLARPASWRWSK